MFKKCPKSHITSHYCYFQAKFLSKIDGIGKVHKKIQSIATFLEAGGRK